ncbi:hypothetical protein ACFWUP_23960 [Nocardia sp. NPDC058658]|uniref:hypothetical protein n=1 Tax=Nocardia sp. NPDC058658 TaxID=3346580 RepID=UPI003661F428
MPENASAADGPGALRRWSALLPRDLVDVAAAGTVLAATALGALTLLATSTGTGSRAEVGATAALLAACLPIYLWHITCAVRDTIPPRAHRSSAVLALLVIGASPVLGAAWLSSVHLVAVVVLLTLRPLPALPIASMLVAGVTPLAVRLGASTPEAIWSAVTTGMRVVAVYTLVWMVVALRRSRSAGAALAEQAVARERLRADSAVTRTIETSLESIAESADRATEFVARGDTGSACQELGALVATSRSGLAQARHLIRSFGNTDLRRELLSATALLAAAGISARIDVPTSGPPAQHEEPLRADLRRLLARLLRDGAAGPVLIAVRQVDTGWLLSCSPDLAVTVDPAVTTDSADLSGFADHSRHIRTGFASSSSRAAIAADGDHGTPKTCPTSAVRHD